MSDKGEAEMSPPTLARPRSTTTGGTTTMTTTAVLFQALPPLSPDEYRDLERDILNNGVLVPIVVDEHDVVIDGHHRQQIAKHHGLPCPREVKTGFTDTEKRSMALSLNINRRQLTREQRRALVAESIKADPQLSDREHGRRTGVDHKTATVVRDELEAGGEIPHLEKRDNPQGRPQPAKKPKPSAPQRDTITIDRETGEVLDNHAAQQVTEPECEMPNKATTQQFAYKGRANHKKQLRVLQNSRPQLGRV